MGKRNGKNGNGHIKVKGYKHTKAEKAEKVEPLDYSNRHIICSKILKPKTISQNNYLKSLESNVITIGIGDAGTGKTILATFYAIQQLLLKRYERLIITRPIVEAGEKLGFLPGELEQKVDPYMRPIVDAIKDIIGPKYKGWMDYYVEVAPLAYLRGRTFNNSILILDEAQNTTEEQMLMFLTRIGTNSKAIITADPTQIDLANKRQSGIFEAIDFLADVPNIQLIYFTEADILRSDIVKYIVAAYNNGRRKENVHGN
jgi:phosphate starvation-inducible protein PhoH and related proteins